MHLSEALAAYLTQLQADGRSKHTIHQARRHARMLIDALGDPAADRLTHAEVARFLASDKVQRTADGRPRRPSSGNALRSSIRGFASYLHAAGLTRANAGRLVRRSRVPPARPRAISEEDARRLLAVMDRGTSPTDARDRALVLVLLRARLRVGSAVALDVEDFQGDRLVLRSMKGGGEDVAYLPPEVARVLVEYVGDRRSGPLFARADGVRLTTRQVARRIEEWAKKAGILGRVSPHRLRHAFAMAVYERTQDVIVTARALGHRSLSAVSVYARPSERRVREAVGA